MTDLQVQLFRAKNVERIVLHVGSSSYRFADPCHYCDSAGSTECERNVEIEVTCGKCSGR